jgi:MarR family transcriptional regulator for hemolysin
METVSEKTALLIDRDAPLYRYQEVVVASVMVSMARGAHGQNLSISQIAALHLVKLRKHMRVGEIADALAMQLPGASKLIADLVTRGLCTRVDDPDDRRAKMVTVTPAGTAFIDEMARSYTTDVPTSIIESTSDVVELFNRIFAALHQAGLTKAPAKS